jgi:precorrin-6B methylase 2
VSGVIDEHRHYLRDRVRVAAYERALARLVRPSHVVVDLASGTGILGLLACRAGAARVYAIEQHGIAGLAREIARANGLGHIVTVVRGRSPAVDPPEPADVVVCDQLGPFGVDAGLLDLAADARTRFLRPGGAFVPNDVTLAVAAAEHAPAHARISFWETRPAGFDFADAARVAANCPSHLRLRRDHLVSASASPVTLDLATEIALPIAVEADLVASRDGIVHGVAGWFSATLAPGVTMTNSPLEADAIRRRQMFFPIRDPIEVGAGTRMHVRLRMLPAEGMYSWQLDVDGRAPARQSTLAGVLLDRDDLERTRPSARPLRSPSAAATLAVLRLCDGHHTLQEIEAEVLAAFPGLFGSPARASAFVAGVLARD